MNGVVLDEEARMDANAHKMHDQISGVGRWLTKETHVFEETLPLEYRSNTIQRLQLQNYIPSVFDRRPEVCIRCFKNSQAAIPRPECHLVVYRLSRTCHSSHMTDSWSWNQESRSKERMRRKQTRPLARE